MNYWVIVGDNPERAVVCEECALKWVQEKMVGGFKKYPAETHWTAQILPGREHSDWDQKTEV